MTHKVMVYDIEHDRQTTREFESARAAHDYATALKRFWLNRPNPAPVHVEVYPV